MSVKSESVEEKYEPSYEYDPYESGRRLNSKDPEQLTETCVNGYIVFFIQKYKHRKYRDENLWEEFIEYFGDWSKSEFEIATRDAIIDLRDFLRQNGVFVLKAPRVSIAGELAKTANEEEQHTWTNDEINYVLGKEQIFNSRYHPDYQASRASAPRSHTSSPFGPSDQLRQLIEAETRKEKETPQDSPRLENKLPDMVEIKNNDLSEGNKRSMVQQLMGVSQRQHISPSPHHHASPPSQMPHEITKHEQTVRRNPYVGRSLDNNPALKPPHSHSPTLGVRVQYPPLPPPTFPATLRYSPSSAIPHSQTQPTQMPDRAQPNNYAPRNENHYSVPPQHQTQYLPVDQPPITDIHRHNIQNSNIPPNFLQSNISNLGNIFKLFKEPHKYNGKTDFLDEKLKIFYDMCATFGVPESLYTNALPAMLTGMAHSYYYDHIAGRGLCFNEICRSLKSHFETEERRYQLLNEWLNLSLPKNIRNSPEKSILECFEDVVSEILKIKRGLDTEYQTDKAMRDRLQLACRDVEACSNATMKPAPSFEALCSDIRLSISTKCRIAANSNYSLLTDSAHLRKDVPDQSYFTDRRYHSTKQRRNQAVVQSSNKQSNTGYQETRQKKCFVCKKFGCWSTNHTHEERETASNLFKQRLQYHKKPYTNGYIQQYILEFEGCPEDAKNENMSTDEYDSLIMSCKLSEENFEDDIDFQDNTFGSSYLTSLGMVDGYAVVSQLNTQSTEHALSRYSPFEDKNIGEIYVNSIRYSSKFFQGIVIDTGAAMWSTAGYAQFQALKRLRSQLSIDKSRAGEANVQFGAGKITKSIGTVNVDTPIGTLTFHVLNTDTPFLLSLSDMNKMKIELRNLSKVLVQKDKVIPVVYKFGHLFLLLNNLVESLTQPFQSDHQIAECHLNEVELRQLHRRFGHPSARRLVRVLQRAGHEFDAKIIEQLTKYCRQCQLHSSSPGRFKFNLKDDCDFNHTLFVDVMYIDDQPILHAVDEATRFEAARWLKNMSAQHTWDTLRACWIDVYIGPPDLITHDAGTNFSSSEFRQYAASMSISTKEVPVEAHQSVGIVERYHAPLRRAYIIIRDELKDKGIDKYMMLQMAVKAINDTAGPDGLIPTLLVFGTYPKLTDLDPPAASISQRAAAIKIAMKEVRRCRAVRQVNDALRQRNGPQTYQIQNLPLKSDVLVWRENKGWTGPFQLLAINGESCTVGVPGGPSNFRSTAVKPYLSADINKTISEIANNANPPGIPDPIRRNPHRHRNTPARYRENQPTTLFISNLSAMTTLITSKERLDLELFKTLQREGKITTIGKPFQSSRDKEIRGLIKNNVFKFVKYEPARMNGIRLFRSRFVDEIKGKGSSTPYEKSRLVIQAYNDNNKHEILTQSPTIQRCSLRLILCIAPGFMPDKKLYLRDISQAYVQSAYPLNRKIYALPPKEISDTIPKGMIMQILRPLYGLAESGAFWFRTYQKHLKEKLSMICSTYDPCLLITNSESKFGIIGLQVDDTLMLGNSKFIELEDAELLKSKLLAKPLESLSPHTPLIFNGGRLTQVGEDILLTPKDQGDRLALVQSNSTSYKDEYVAQRARGAYIASICQPEASYDLSVAAQQQDPTEKDVDRLNTRLEWQINNKHKGLRFVPVKLQSAKMFVFVDGSFANNKDLSSQIGFVIVLANESKNDNYFEIRGNIIHWSSVKCRRVTRSVLASELYAMVQGVDAAFAMNTTLKLITKQLDLESVPIVICTDSFSLYECMVKLGTTKEKRLMIDIMAIRESYERRELSEIRWINGNDNPADSMTKYTPTKALENLTNSNTLSIRVEGWVDRKEFDTKGGEVEARAQEEEVPSVGI